MPKKQNDRPIVKDDPSRILDTTMEDVMHNSMIPYAEHVILERALPRVEDGLKPVQRRILYTMLELGTTPDKPHRKCARIVGDCLGKFHPHGDSSVYGALVRMAQGFVMRGPMVDGHGNFGSIDGDGAAAMRYTEARMTPLAMQMLRDIEKDTVPFRLNFDDTLREPDMLPARFPNLLVNGADGIAVGLATNIPPHNLGEAIGAAIAVIENPEISLEELMQTIPGPDFPTGGVLVDNDEIRLGYETGRSKLQVRARLHLEDAAAGRKLIVITDVPYGVNKAAMLEKIQRLKEEKKGVFNDIYDIRDESDREGLRAVIETRRDADTDKLLAALYKYSDLQITFGVNMVAIADGKPVQMGLKQMLVYFIQHQKNVVTRRTQYDLKQAEARAHILEGLMIAVDHLDEVIALIRQSKNPKEARTRLMDRFSLDEAQAQAILDMRLQRLTNLEILALKKEYEELQKLIKRLRAILGSEKKLMEVISEELRQVAQEYADPRRTSIEKVEETVLTKADTAPEAEDAVVIYTHAGQLKRINPALLKKTPLPAVQEDTKEAPLFRFDTKTDETLLIFTNLGNCYQLRVSQLTECKPKDRGQLLTGLNKDWEEDEVPVWLWCGAMDSLNGEPDFLFVTAQGQVKRTEAAEYNIRTKKTAAVKLKKGDRLLCVIPLTSADDVLLMTKTGLALRFALEEVSVQGRIAGGVRGMNTVPGDELCFAAQLGAMDELVLITERGYGKRVLAMDMEKQGRGGKGTRALAFARTGANGQQLAGACLLNEKEKNQKLVLLQARSLPTVLQAQEIPLQSRTGRGSPLVMAVLDDVVTSVEKTGNAIVS